MEATVDELSAAYDEFVAAAAAVLEARAQSGGGEKTAATDAALEAFKQRWELFRVACDHAEELVESIRQRIGSECLVDEATGSSVCASAGSASAPGIKPISAVRLEQMSKAVRWLVIELQHGAGGASVPGAGGGGGAMTPSGGAGGGAGGQHGHGGVDARFPEDGPQ
ncbi:mediator of RNA polymerase II transcription subunit 32 [Phragmites australis]|uniref:mediator of RNA polymerase II transcription subunit 32 n=1 Tax=Phragmites australis TaxID=29695 RepID=UPI002D768AF4|nr:mediator of RNA polymerase II transcription subunit 32 [Phragmites australis]